MFFLDWDEERADLNFSVLHEKGIRLAKRKGRKTTARAVGPVSADTQEMPSPTTIIL